MRLVLRCAITALALTIAATGLTTPAGAADTFGDVDADTWYSQPVAWLVSEGITTGTSPGCFSPSEQVTRGQIVTFLFRLDRARGLDPQPTDHPFTDVVRDYQQAPVGWAYAEGITTGTTSTSFAPDAPVTRGDFAVLLWRYAGRPTTTHAHPFTDVTRAYQQGAIAWMADAGITTGTSATTFTPDGAMTRAEAAAFFHRFMNEPIVVAVAAASTTEPVTCVAEYAALLAGVGLLPVEANCVAPFLTGLDLDTVAAILAGEHPIDSELISLLSDILSAGCIPTIDRQAALIRALL
ncbi:MAG: S-layer homology domain-containing protein [Actinomycetota bacterium]